MDFLLKNFFLKILQSLSYLRWMLYKAKDNNTWEGKVKQSPIGICKSKFLATYNLEFSLIVHYLTHWLKISSNFVLRQKDCKNQNKSEPAVKQSPTIDCIIKTDN